MEEEKNLRFFEVFFLVLLHVSFSSETLLTHWTWERLLTGVYAEMYIKI